MRKKFFLLISGLMIFGLLFLTAEEKVFLEDLLKEAKENNPEIKILQKKFLASKQWPIIARTWEHPRIGFELQNTEQMLAVSQMFTFPGKLSLRSKIAEQESKVVEQELNSKVREILAEVKKDYWSYWLVHKTIEVYQENIDLMKRFLNIAKTQYAIGRVTQTDILKANIELAEMENMLIMLEQEKISLQAKLNALLNRPSEISLGKPEKPVEKEVKYSPEELEKISLKNRPDLLVKESLDNSKAAGLSLARREWFPDIMAGVKISNLGNQTYMFQISHPIYFWKQNAIVQAMKNEKKMAEQDLQSARVTTLQMVKDLWTKYDAHRRLVLTYETSIIPLAKQTLTLTESGYRTGKNDFLDLLDSQKRYLSYNIDYHRHIAESQIYLIDLEKIVGVDFQ